MRLKNKVLTGAIILAVTLGLAFGLYKCQRQRDISIGNPILGPNVKEKIILNPLRHSIVIITTEGIKATTLPDRPSSIEIYKDGKVKTIIPQWGYEAVPFIGIGWSGQLNDYVGIDGFYWKRLDVGTAFSFDRDLKVKSIGFPFVLSYAVWHNTRLSVGYEMFGPTHAVHGLVSVRL
jgi:hypothetical protein